MSFQSEVIDTFAGLVPSTAWELMLDDGIEFMVAEKETETQYNGIASVRTASGEEYIITIHASLDDEGTDLFRVELQKEAALTEQRPIFVDWSQRTLAAEATYRDQ